MQTTIQFIYCLEFDYFPFSYVLYCLLPGFPYLKGSQHQDSYQRETIPDKFVFFFQNW